MVIQPTEKVAAMPVNEPVQATIPKPAEKATAAKVVHKPIETLMDELVDMIAGKPAAAAALEKPLESMMHRTRRNDGGQAPLKTWPVRPVNKPVGKTDNPFPNRSQAMAAKPAEEVADKVVDKPVEPDNPFQTVAEAMTAKPKIADNPVETAETFQLGASRRPVPNHSRSHGGQAG